ncbi:MAG: SHOCT domain-containing protein [Acidimicrobiia bacterium]
MSSRLEDLRDLAQMLDEGKITQREYEMVKTELLEAPADEWATSGPLPEVEALPVEADAVPTGIPVHSNGGEHHPEETARGVGTDLLEPEAGDGPSTDPDWLAFAKQIPPLYWASIGAGLLSVFFAGSFSPLAWATAVVAIVALVRVKDPNMRWMAWTGLAVGVLFSLLGMANSGSAGSVDAGPLPATSSEPEELEEIPVGSLGVRFADLEEGWNALDEPPYILKGISTTPEAGPLDSFIYRFDGGAVLAGAYNPSDDYIYALMGRAGVSHEASSSMYVHLCYLLYPGTQDCFDAYVDESGVFGKTAAELANADHSSSWLYDSNEWRLEIANGIETLRVLGPQEAGA